ncbi:MAG TPA: hypothetical protein G4O03_01950 [Dehalococcoidia bacterium]|nr:hypothetical protein [Dehalococcoidia bacterium]
MSKVDRTYTEDGAEGSEWRQAITRLLAKGLFQYLKREGLLRQDKGRQDAVSRLLQDTSRLILDRPDDQQERLDSSPDLSMNGAESEGEAPS